MIVLPWLLKLAIAWYARAGGVIFVQISLQKLAASPGAAAAYSEVVVYRDLLLLGDLATISQEKRPYQWIQQAGSLSGPGTPPHPDILL